MTEDRSTDPASPIPLAAPLTDRPLDPDQPDPGEVFGMGAAPELDHLVSDPDVGTRDA